MTIFGKKVDRILLPDSEFDIEHEAVFSIERDGDITTIGFYPHDHSGLSEWEILTTLEKHNDYVKRYRKKLHIKNYDSVESNNESISDALHDEERSQ